MPLDEIDLASWDFWAQDDDFRDGAFATPRREAPIAFHQELAQEGTGTGHWALTRCDDAWYASRDLLATYPARQPAPRQNA